MIVPPKPSPYWLVAILCCSLWFAPYAFSQESAVQPSQSATSQATLDVRQLVELAEQIESMRVAWAVPGLAVGVVKDDQVLLCQGFGLRRTGGLDPVDEHTLFAIASNSKAFTAAALAMLVDEGKLTWDDRVADTLPWLKLKDSQATLDLRIRDLLCHRSGLGTFSGDLLWWGTEYSPREVLERTAHLDPASPFRTKYGYSNLMFLAAGEVVAKVSGQSWSDFVQQRFLMPLNMERTITSVAQLESQGNFATPHKTFLDHSLPLGWINWDAMAAAGGIISSVDDMSQWLRLQLRQGALPDGQRLFSDEQSHEMWQAQMPIPISRSATSRSPTTHFRAYGLGWSLSDYRGRKLVGHGGGYDGMYSQVLMVPEEGLGIVVLTNSMTGVGTAIANTIVDRFLGPDVASPPRDWSGEGLTLFRKSRREFEQRIAKLTTPVVVGTHPSQPMQNYCGTFRCPMYGDATVEFENNALVLKLLPNRQLIADLTHLHYDTFQVTWREEFAWFGGGTAHFVTDARGTFHRLELNIPNDDLWFDELKLSRVE